MTHPSNIKCQTLFVRALPWIGMAAAFATVVVGISLDLSGTQLGVPHPPFIGAWGPQAHLLLAVAIPCFAGAVALVPALLRWASTWGFAAALFAVTLVLRVTLSVARGGPDRLDNAFRMPGEGYNEYLPSLAAFDYGPSFFLDRFAELVPALPVHSAGHPPGLLLVMHYAGIDTAPKLAAFCLVVGALSAPLTYMLARSLFDGERTARIAGILAAFAPALLHYGATSADAVYLTLGLCAAIPLMHGRLWLGGVILAVISLFAWSLLAIAAWAAVLVLARDGVKPALKLAAVTGAVLLAFHALFALATGFDPLGTLQATSRVYDVGIASRRPYAFWLFGSPAAFLLILGAPIFWLALKALALRAPEALAIAAVIAFSCVLGFTKAETERIWLFYGPLVIVAAAPLVRRPQLLAAVLAVQAVGYELLFDTLW